MTNFIKYENIKSLQFDPTSYCNLLCPQCSRVEKGGINPSLPLCELTKTDYISILNPELLKQLDKILFNGNYGDCIISSHFMFAVEHIFSYAEPSFMAWTNGSLRNEKWWKNLAYILKNKEHTVVFSIDGLKDTNNKYRINSNFDKIISNATAFISSGGTARWDFLVFKHNEHQVETAKTFAKKLGFKKFTVKQTVRFNDHRAYSVNKNISETLIFNKQNKVIDKLEEPQKNSSSIMFENIIKKYGSWNNYINKSSISCKFQKERTLFVDFMAQLWPCCWLAAPLYFHNKNNSQKKQLSAILKKYGEDFNSLRKHSIKEILNHPWFQSELTQSWFNSLSDSNFKLMTCGRTCGDKYEFSSGEKWKNSQTFRL